VEISRKSDGSIKAGKDRSLANIYSEK